MRERLIRAGVNNLIEFGYPHCNKQNIMTDPIYKEFFRRMLEENKGIRADIDATIDSLLLEIGGAA